MRRRRQAGGVRSSSDVGGSQQPKATASSCWAAWLGSPTAAAPLLLFRSSWAACLLKEIWDEQPRLAVQYGPGVLNFKYPIAPLPTPSLAAIHALFVVMALAGSFLVVAPLLTARTAPARAASIALGLSYGAVFLLEAQRYNNHYYLSVLLAAWFSLLDVYYLPTGNGKPQAVVPRWQLSAVQLQLVLVYFFGGVAKLSEDWYSGATWLAMGATNEHGKAALRGTIPLARDTLLALGAPAEWAQTHTVARLLSIAGAWFDLLIGPCLLQTAAPPLRWLGLTADDGELHLYMSVWRWCCGTAAGFHALNAIGLQIGVFPLTMLASTCLFLPRWPNPDTSAFFAARCGPPQPPRAVTGVSTSAIVGLALGLTQLLLPLRPMYYQTLVHSQQASGEAASIAPLAISQPEWSAAGHHFSWRMMTRSVQFFHCGITVSVQPPTSMHRARTKRPPLIAPAVYQLDMPDIIAHLSYAGNTTAMAFAAAQDSGSSVRGELRAVEACADPEQLRQFAVHLAGFFRRRESERTGVLPYVSVKADVWVSVNGPPFTRLVDPTFDLASAPSPNLVAGYSWVRGRTTAFRTREWRQKYETLKAAWQARGYDLLGPCELWPGEEKTHGVAMPAAPPGSGPGAGRAANWYYVVFLSGEAGLEVGERGAVTAMDSPPEPASGAPPNSARVPADAPHTIKAKGHALWVYLIPTPGLVGATAPAILHAEAVIPDPATPEHFLVTVPEGAEGKIVRAVLPAVKEREKSQSVDFVAPALPASGSRQIRVTRPARG